MQLPIATSETIDSVVTSDHAITATAPLWAFPQLGYVGVLDWVTGTWADASALNAISGEYQRTAVSPVLSSGDPLIRGEVYVAMLRPYPGETDDPVIVVDTIEVT